MEEKSKTRAQKVLECLTDGRARSPSEIFNETKVTKLDSLLHEMWKKGLILASQIVYTYKPVQRKGKWIWSRSRQRFYIIRKGKEEEKKAKVTYETFDKRQGCLVKIEEELTFTTYEKAKDKIEKENTSKLVFELLRNSKVALFAEEIASKLKIENRNAVRTALVYLQKQGKVQKAGYFNPIYGRESKFPKGYLYFIDNKQYENRINQHDVLKGRKQRVYETILRNTKIQRRFTPKTELFGSAEQSRWEDVMKELLAVYKDVIRIEIAGETFYYIKGILSKEEIEQQKVYWTKKKSEKSSLHCNLGHAHEEFFQVATECMWRDNALKIEDMWWEFTIKDGKKRYSVYKTRRSDPKRVYEFDRVLHCKLAPFSNGKYTCEIILVFESKYTRRLDKRYWQRFLEKLADTFDFGMVTEVKTVDGNRVKVRAIKHNVIPVIVIPWAGEKNIEVESGEKLSLAQYVISHGGLVIFTSEFEKYLEKRLGKKVNFKKLFKTWLENEKEKEFTTYLLKYLFGSTKVFEREIKTKEIKKKVESDKVNKEIKFGEFIKPMLLNEYLGEWFDNPIVVEPKIDGIRIQLHLDKEKGIVLAFTRNGKKKNVEWLFEVLKEVKCKKCILDGELVKDKVFVFDVLMADGSITIEKPLYERRDILEKIIEREGKRLVIIPQFKVKDRDELKELFDTIVDAGYEGIVIKDESSVYFPGVRSSRWLKWKEVKTIDLFVHKVYKDESKKHRKWVHELACWKDGKPFIVFKYPSVEKMEEGTVVEIEFNQITKNGKIRHIKNLRIRKDKSKYEVENFNFL